MFLAKSNLKIKTMKKNILLLLSFLMGGQLMAQDDDTTTFERDTTVIDTKVRIGKIVITIEGENADTTIHFDDEKKEVKFPRVITGVSFDFGVAGYSKEKTGEVFYINAPEAAAISTASGNLDFGKSRNIGVNFSLVFDITRNFGIVTGLSLNYNKYRFTDNIVVTPKFGTFHEDSIISYSSYKFKNSYVELPLMLKLQSSNRNFQFAAGGIVGYNFASKVKAKYSIDGGEYMTKVEDSFGTEPLRLSVGARFNYHAIGLYFKYGLNEFLKGTEQNQTGYNGYRLMPFEAGITFGTF